MKAQISQQEAITNFLNKCNNNSKPTTINNMKKQPINTLDNFPVNVEVYRALENGKVIFQDPCRAIVNSFITRNNLIGRPGKAIVPFNSIYSAAEKMGELIMN